jgi:hypothetical protein
MKFRVLWHTEPCSHVEVDRCFRGVYCLHHQDVLTMEAVRTRVTTRRYIPEDSTLHTRHHQNLSSHIVAYHLRGIKNF